MSAGAVELAVVIAFAIAALAVFAAAGVVAFRAARTARTLKQRSSAPMLASIRTKIQSSQADVERIRRAIDEFSPLAQRAAIASASIALTLATYRGQLARLGL